MRNNVITKSAKLFKQLFEEDLTLAKQKSRLLTLAPENLSPEDIAQCYRVMMGYAETVSGISELVVDIVGTGGDGLNTFNISTTAAFVAAGAGIKVAKNGSSSARSLSSSVALLEALNVDIPQIPAEARQQLENFGLTFIMQSYFHPRVLPFQEARAVLAQNGARTIFDVLGPIINAGRVKRKALGVYLPELVDVYAEVLSLLGIKKAMVFHGAGMDELSLAGENDIAILHQGKIEKMSLTAGDTCLPACCIDDLVGGHPHENADVALAILQRDYMGPKRNTIILNAAAAVFVGYPENISLFDAINIAQESLDSGAALKCLMAVQKK